MVHKQKLTKIGNSVGIILPKQLLDSLGLNVGQEVFLEQVQDKVVLDTKKSSSISPEFLRIAEGVGKKYAEAFEELAK